MPSSRRCHFSLRLRAGRGLQHHQSPYARMGLWRNPFGELTAAERAELAVVPVEPLLDFLKHERRALQIIGDCGCGKSTHLLALRAWLPEAGWVYFPERGPRPRLPQCRPLLVDEAQRMGWRRRRQLLGSPGPLALTTHVDLSSQLRRAGYQVQTLDVEIPKTPHCLAEILNRRIAASSLLSVSSGDLPFRIDEDFAQKLLVRFGPNLRQMEAYLYHELENCILGKRVWPPVT